MVHRLGTLAIVRHWTQVLTVAEGSHASIDQLLWYDLVIILDRQDALGSVAAAELNPRIIVVGLAELDRLVATHLGSLVANQDLPQTRSL